MSNFMETYGKALFVLILIAILIAFASPIGVKIKTAVLAQVDKLDSIGNEEIEDRNSKNYKTVDTEKLWTESHTNSYFFERVSSDKTSADYNKWKSNNKGKDSTSAVSTFTIETTSETEYSFDWTVSSESNYDKLTITCNGTTIVNGVSGTKNGTQKVTLKSGMNTLKATYSKDSSSASGDDCATITLSNIKISGCKNKQTGEISNHIYDKGKITKEATCTKNGEKTFTCKNCGNTKIEVINKLGHNYDNGKITKATTCTKNGEKLFTCKKCSNTKTEVINKLGHNYDNGKITKAATCSTNGEKLFTCKKCGNTKTESINKLNHNFVNGICTNCGFKTSDMPAVDQIYCIYYSYEKDRGDGCMIQENELVIAQNEIEPETDKTVVKKGFFEKPMDCTTDMDTVRFEGIVKPKSCKNWFGNYYDDKCDNLREIKNIQNLDTSECTNMDDMFCGCRSLTSLNLNHFDTSNVISMDGMFEQCTSLISLEISNWNVSRVTNMAGMVMECSSLTSLNLNNWNVSNVTHMNNMFQCCSSFINLDVSNWNVSSVTHMEGMFWEFGGPITSLDLSNWDISNVTDMYDIFFDMYPRNSDTIEIKISRNMFNKIVELSGNSNTSNNSYLDHDCCAYFLTIIDE